MKPEKGILLIFHGSVHPGTLKVIEEVTASVRKRTRFPVKVTTLPEMKKSLEPLRAFSKEVVRLFAIPVFVSPGVHTEEDIPKLLRELGNVVYGHPLAPDSRISDIIFDRLRECQTGDGPVTWDYENSGIPDEFFLKSKEGLTREEIRTIILAKARVKKGAKVLDAGTGSGSVAIEFALLGCKVVAIEKREENLEIARRNFERFGVQEDVCLISGDIAQVELKEQFDVVFIGGSEDLENSLHNCVKHLRQEGRIIIAAVKLETIAIALKGMKDAGIDPEILSVSLSKGKKLGDGTLLSPSYPISLIWGEKP